ncbi:MAG TPA: VIT domain-containing protein [Myxococcota bacterium]|nr:VIT domain-containing protein [Myxococcota bacterium]
MKIEIKREKTGRLWYKGFLILAALFVWVPPFFIGACPAPEPASPLQARLELAAGDVSLEQAGTSGPAFSGAALLADSHLATGKGARALVRLSNGASIFMRGGSKIFLGSEAVELFEGEIWLDAPPTERQAIAHKIGAVTVFAVDAGLSIKKTAQGADVYVARGGATINAPGGRVDVHGGEQAGVIGSAAPVVKPVVFWEDWTGGMADRPLKGSLAGAGSGQVYGVDLNSPTSTQAMTMEIARQSVRVVIRSGLAETEVDQTFFNPTDRPLEGWYWFSVPQEASVTGFALETNGVLVEGEFVERRQAARQYKQAIASSLQPALLEWIDSRTFRARIYPLPAAGSRRVVLRYLQLLPVVKGTLRYVYPLQSSEPVRIGEFSLNIDLGAEGKDMEITTLADARVESGGELVSMRRSGYVPRADFMLEAHINTPPEPIRVATMKAAGDTADYLMVRYTPDFDWLKGGKLKGEIAVVVDTSADSDPANRSMKIDAAEAILRALSGEDRFALIALDVRPTVLYPAKGLAPASEAEINKALERLSEFASGGATDLSALFEASLERLHGGEQPAVVYIGDGIATSGEMNSDRLVERLHHELSTSKARLFTVAVGPGANYSLLSTLAQAGGGEAFQVGDSEQINQQVLQLVAALKTPTMTDFDMDLGAGLDEVFVSANGKVKHGEQVIVLARTHHSIPVKIVVKGKLAGEKIVKEYMISPDSSIVASFVARLWAAEYLRRLTGSVTDSESRRGKIMKLGMDYGLMTPFTSILALDSEQAYRQQGILRRKSTLRGARLSHWVKGGEHETDYAQIATDSIGFGCSREKTAQESAPGTSRKISTTEDVARRPSVSAGGKYEQKRMAPVATGGLAERTMAAPTKKISRPEAKAKTTSSDGAKEGTKNALGMVSLMKTCSDVSRRSLRERVIMWRKRMRTARSPQEIVARYQAARAACEIFDWRSEAAFFRVLRPFIRDEGSASYVLEFFSQRPEIQRFLARLILRRAVDQRVIAVVEKILFRGEINWASVDNELAAIGDFARRIERLRQIVARAPDDPNGIVRLMHLLVKNDQIDEALIQGRRLRDSGLITPYLAREIGDVLASRKLSDEAVRTYSEIVEFDPGSVLSRRLLGDIYLAHGWYDPAYNQYETLTNKDPQQPLYWLRLAAAAAGAGRLDQALRLERKVSSAPGRPGPEDPRQWAKLWSATRLARLLSSPPQGVSTNSIQGKLKQLQLFSGKGSLLIITWEDLSADLQLAALRKNSQVSVGEATDAAKSGLSAILVPSGDLGHFALSAVLRTPPARRPILLKRHDITWDGRKFEAKITSYSLAAGATKLAM